MSKERAEEILSDNNTARIEMVGEGESIKQRGAEKTKVITAFNLFQTPPFLASWMVSMLPKGEQHILEPSAGLGRIVTALQRKGKGVTAIDNDTECSEHLYNNFKGITLCQGDFLAMKPPHILYDGVVMNPPFKQGRDIKHILHAYEFMKKGGVLIALCYNGVAQNKKLKYWADTWETLPDDTFKSEGTTAKVALITKVKE